MYLEIGCYHSLACYSRTSIEGASALRVFPYNAGGAWLPLFLIDLRLLDSDVLEDSNRDHMLRNNRGET